MRCELRSAEETLFDGEATMVVAHSPLGEFGILPHHAPLLAALNTGPLRIQTREGERVFVLRSGLLRVEADRVTVLAEGAIRAEAIDLAAVRARREAIQAKRSAGEEGGIPSDLAYLRAQEKAGVRRGL
jgi:F-type H+-transporting ATPase subunit epsilon